METITLYYATNRKHESKNNDRWHPESYGTSFSADGMENLRFGKVTINVDNAKVEKHLKDMDRGELSSYFTNCAKSANIEAYEEKTDPNILDSQQKDKLGSPVMFADIKKEMEQSTDILVFIHGFNVSWYNAVGSAITLQSMLNRSRIGDKSQKVLVILFTWPSDGTALPYASYKSDRCDAKGSGYAFGRSILKLRDFLIDLNIAVKRKQANFCARNIHLLCHSMGNYVLQNALSKIIKFIPINGVLPKIFEHIFLCAPDVNDNVLENGQPMDRLHELCQHVSIYHNRQDVAMDASDYTKGNPERLGRGGAAHPSLLHNKIHQIDCSPIVHGMIEHSYYLEGPVTEDIRLSMDGITFDDSKRKRRRDSNMYNMWIMKASS